MGCKGEGKPGTKSDKRATKEKTVLAVFWAERYAEAEWDEGLELPSRLATWCSLGVLPKVISVE